jgi:hypothetical protein
MPMIRAFKGLVALLVLVAAPAAAQDASGLSWLTGSWRGGGTMFGRPSEATLEIRPVLGGRFVELSYRAGGFEGRAFYRPSGEGRWQATWFDNRGATFAIEAALAGRTLTADWGSAETEQGRTIYRRAEDGRLHVSDSVLSRDGSQRPFASHVLTRAD